MTTACDTGAVVVGKSEIIRFANIVAAAFSNDALNRYMFLGRESRPGHPKLDQLDLRVEYWLPAITARSEKGGVLVQTCDWAGVALWIPPGIEKPFTSGASEAGLEYRDKFDYLKKKHFGERTYWYLNIIARAPTRTQKGAIRELVDPFLQKARDQGVPVWLEATNEHAREVYVHLGFKVVEQVRIGQGIVNDEGYVQPNGDGVLVYGMLTGI